MSQVPAPPYSIHTTSEELVEESAVPNMSSAIVEHRAPPNEPRSTSNPEPPDAPMSPVEAILDETQQTATTEDHKHIEDFTPIVGKNQSQEESATTLQDEQQAEQQAAGDAGGSKKSNKPQGMQGTSTSGGMSSTSIMPAPIISSAGTQPIHQPPTINKQPRPLFRRKRTVGRGRVDDADQEVQQILSGDVAEPRQALSDALVHVYLSQFRALFYKCFFMIFNNLGVMATLLFLPVVFVFLLEGLHQLEQKPSALVNFEDVANTLNAQLPTCLRQFVV